MGRRGRRGDERTGEDRTGEDRRGEKDIPLVPDCKDPVPPESFPSTPFLILTVLN